MTRREPELDFQRLRETRVPRPSAGAKERAIAAASSAFAEASTKIPGTTKGSQAAARLTPSTRSGWWRTAMQNRVLMGSVAASVLVIPMAAMLAIQGGLSTLERRSPVDLASRVDVAAPAPARSPPRPRSRRGSGSRTSRARRSSRNRLRIGRMNP